MRVVFFLLAVLLLSGPISANAAEMRFSHVRQDSICNTCAWIFAEGEIAPHSGQALQTYLTNNGIPAGSVIFLNSPGGSLIGGLELGAVIRQSRLQTAISKAPDSAALPDRGDCASACFFAFVGGVSRSVSQYSRLGVHQFAGSGSTTMTAPQALSTAQSVTSSLGAYLERMHVDQGVLSIAGRTLPNQMHWLTPLELRRHRVTNSTAYQFIDRWELSANPRLGHNADATMTNIQADGSLGRFQLNCDRFGGQISGRISISIDGPEPLSNEDLLAIQGVRTLQLQDPQSGQILMSSPAQLLYKMVLDPGRTRITHLAELNLEHFGRLFDTRDHVRVVLSPRDASSALLPNRDMRSGNTKTIVRDIQMICAGQAPYRKPQVSP